jgi:hypothetical protein
MYASSMYVGHLEVGDTRTYCLSGLSTDSVGGNTDWEVFNIQYQILQQFLVFKYSLNTKYR